MSNGNKSMGSRGEYEIIFTTGKEYQIHNASGYIHSVGDFETACTFRLKMIQADMMEIAAGFLGAYLAK